MNDKIDMSNVELLPVWKKGATAGDRLREIAQVADKHPEQFEKFVVIYAEDNERKLVYRYMNGEGTRTSDCIGLCQAGAMHIYESTRK